MRPVRVPVMITERLETAAAINRKLPKRVPSTAPIPVATPLRAVA